MSSYEETYQRWVMSLPKSKQAKLKKLGLDKPLNDQGKLNTPNNADVVFANLGTDFDYDSLDSSIFNKNDNNEDIGEISTMEQKEQQSKNDNQIKAEASLMVSYIIRKLFSHSKPSRFYFDMICIGFAIGDSLLISDKTQTQVAKDFKMTRANVSNRVKFWQCILGVKPSQFMKSQEACKAFRRARIKNLTT